VNGYPYSGPHKEFGGLPRLWARFWLLFSGARGLGRIGSRLAALAAPPHKGRVILAQLSGKGFIEHTATIYHSKLSMGSGCFIGDRVLIYQRNGGGPIELGDKVYIYRDAILETGVNGSILIGANSSLHPKCQLHANVSSITIGSGVMIASNCCLYSYDHGTKPQETVRSQPLTSKGDIVIGNEAWIGSGVTILSGVVVGKGAILAAGSLVTRSIPDNAVAAGVPAKVIKMRE
jgi:acetyltransferase-like isoleucine patch superfamily enzyme